MQLSFNDLAKVFTLLALTGMLVEPGRVMAQGEGRAGTRPIIHEAGVSARAYGLGRAYVAVADEPGAVFWNPAGLEYVPRTSFSLFHTSLIEGMSLDFLGFVYPTLQFGTLGVGISRFGSGDDLVLRNESNVVETENASFDMTEIYISYGKVLPLNVSAGLTFKVQRQSLSFTNQDGSAFGLDLGLMYRPQIDSGILNGLSLGFHFQNLLKPAVKLGANDDTLGTQLSFGIMKGIPVGLSGRLNIVVDYSQGQYEGGTFRAGTEYQFREMGAIRAGFDDSSPAFGLGLTYKFLQIDYSFSNLSDESAFSMSHRFSLTFTLGDSREEKVLKAIEERRRREKELVERTKEEERQRRIAENMQKGKEYLEQGRYFDAYSEFQQVISADPFNKTAKVYFDSSTALIQEQFDRRQQEAIAQAVDKELEVENQKYLDLHFEKGQVFLQKRQYTEALKEFNLALERAPDDPIIQEAINTTTRRLNTDVKNLIASARGEFQQGNYSEALRILGEALVLSPESPELQEEINRFANRIKIQQYVQRGLNLLDQGEYQKALSVFEEALTLDPSNEAIRQYIDRTKVGMGTKRETMDPESERQYLIGTDLFLKGRYKEALEIWRKLVEKYPYNKKLQDAIKTAEDRIKRTQGN